MKIRFKKLFDQHRRMWTIGLIAGTILLVAWFGWLWYKLDAAVVRTDPEAVTNSKPAVEFVNSPLTGEKVSPELAKRPILVVQIENSFEARPQSGLNKAGVIIEAIAEAGITRFSAYFQETEPSILGPVRSLRPYFIDWLLGFDANVVHVGGSTQATSMISSLGVKSLDVSGAYYRASDRYAPHNAYSSYNDLKSVMQRLGYYKASKFTPITRKVPAALEIPTARVINIDVSSSLFNVDYTYNKTCNCYLRNMAGAPHKDRESGNQLSPNVAVVLKIPQRVIDNVGHIGMDTIGSGSGYIFQDGGVIKVTWKKASRTEQIKFFDVKNQEIGLNPGQTWITVIPDTKSVNYQP